MYPEWHKMDTLSLKKEGPDVLVHFSKPCDGHSYGILTRCKISNGIMVQVNGHFSFDMPMEDIDAWMEIYPYET